MQKVLGQIRKVRFTKFTLRQASIREKKGSSLGKIQVKSPHQRSPYVMKFEDRSHKETERQQRCVQSKAWNLAKNMYKLKEKDKATFWSSAEQWVTPGCVNKTSRRKESLRWIPELVCIWSVSETLTLLSWRPWGHRGVRDGDDDQRRDANKRRSKNIRQRIGLVRNGYASF